jgi:hypothetical protein
MEYKASLDTLAKIITIGVVILFIVIGLQSVKALLVAKGDSTIILMHAGILLLLCCNHSRQLALCAAVIHSRQN